MSKLKIYKDEIKNISLSNYVKELEKFFNVFSEELEQKNRTWQFGCYWTDEELAKHIKENRWDQPGEWLEEYRDKKGKLTETFFEDVNEEGDFKCCDKCNKWGEISMNHYFDQDFYCDMCVVNDIQEDQHKVDFNNYDYDFEYSKNWEKNIDELIDYLQEFKKTERKKKIESDAEFYEFMSNQYGNKWSKFSENNE
jgi:hypothetical protein|tara:strand:+ start:3070 stop:3657 length:588 start_codon:yes stop_codon:yes gene_type:complete